MFTQAIRMKTQVALTPKPVPFPLHHAVAHMEVGREGQGLSAGENPEPQEKTDWRDAKVLALQHCSSMLRQGWGRHKQMISMGQPMGDRETEAEK